MADYDKLVDFFFEAGQLKRVKRSGWWLINIKEPESVAEHSQRSAIIGYILAKLEKADAGKVVLSCLFHDLDEARLNDLHKVGQRYIDFKAAESNVIIDQLEMLPIDAKSELQELLNSTFRDSSKEGIIARDADLLECACQAKEYIEAGHKDAQNWIDNVRGIMKTESAKQLLTVIEKKSSNDWWKGLKKIKR